MHVSCDQDAVEELAMNPPSVIERLRPTLRDLKDLDPAIASLHHRRIQPSRLLSLLGTMRKVCSRGQKWNMGMWNGGLASGYGSALGRRSFSKSSTSTCSYLFGPRQQLMVAKGVAGNHNRFPIYLAEQRTEKCLGQVFAVFHPPAVRATAANGTEASHDVARSAVLKEAVRGVPDGMVPVIARYVGELDATAAASVSNKTLPSVWSL